VGTVRNFRVP